MGSEGLNVLAARRGRSSGLLAILLAALPILGACESVVGVSAGDLYGSDDGVVLVVTESGADLEWDCAAGQIEEPLEPAGDGRFDLGGTYTPGVGLPVREDDPPRAEPARYVGRFSGSSRMELTVELPERDTSLGPYVLRLGHEVVLHRCL